MNDSPETGPCILLAPDKFKGSLTAAEVREACEKGLSGIFPAATFLHAPVADGGEGTTEAIIDARGGKLEQVDVLDPLGRPITACFAMVEVQGKRVAVMEMSVASGFERVLDVVPPEPGRASTFGTGQMIRAAAMHGAEQILIGIGGSATNDGGAGMAEALGYRFYDKENFILPALPDRLEELVRISPPATVGTLPELLVACDVDNPLLGARGATRVYGPQKGIREEELTRFEARLVAMADAAETMVEKPLRDLPGAGAAGGLGFGLMAFCDAQLHPGFELVAEITQLREQITAADLIITGEGSLDAQTLHGKGPAGVAAMAHAQGKPVLAICGVTDPEVPGLNKVFSLILPLRPLASSTEEAIAHAAELISHAIRESQDLIRPLVRASS